VINFLIWSATASIILSFTYTVGMYLEGRSSVPAPGHAARSLFFVFLIPCLNEERVISATLDRLHGMGLQNFLVIVIDDACDDETAQVVRSRATEHVLLLRRSLPEARKGKGAALNAAIEHLVDHPRLHGRASADIVICLLDADGRLDPSAPEAASRCFADPRVGGVQVAVRIENRDEGVLARLQDMEFVCYTEIFQRCRSLGGFAGLGGNGQFTRLSALVSLGRQPWSASILTEDLDLGVRLGLAGWRTAYTSEAAVNQQGLKDIRRLVRQRSRWFQGLLQCWRLIPSVARQAAGRRRMDTLHLLLSPVLIFAAFLMTLSFVVASIEWLTAPGPYADGYLLRVVVAWYVLTFSPAVFLAVIYRRVSGLGLLRSLGLGHTFVLYGLLWVAAGVRGLWRLLLGRHGWLKTDRLLESARSESAPLRRLEAGEVAANMSENNRAAHDRPGGQVTKDRGQARPDWLT
jgi:1,2-diacylglycerol 3-beta-glucosyltransferase